MWQGLRCDKTSELQYKMVIATEESPLGQPAEHDSIAIRYAPLVSVIKDVLRPFGIEFSFIGMNNGCGQITRHSGENDLLLGKNFSQSKQHGNYNQNRGDMDSLSPMVEVGSTLSAVNSASIPNSGSDSAIISRTNVE